LMKPMRNWLPVLAALANAAAAPAASENMTCRLTGKEVKECCSEQQKDGKILCKLANKTVEKCCCKGM
jgi:hypothetical protein